MELVKVETPGIAHYAYVLEDGGRAAVIDPRRDVQEYIDIARRLGARIEYVIETHRQEDFVMGSAHLAQRTGARVVTGHHEIFGHGDVRLGDGDELGLGSLTLQALHTPGHTPESMSYAIFTKQDPADAWGVFTGDALFFGTTGRTDLPDANRSRENAALLYDSVHAKLAPLSDTALVLPAHGPGSVCGSGMAPLPSSTIGAERRTNEVFTSSRDEFAEKKGSEQIPRPPYFRYMEDVNRRGGVAPVLLPGDVALLDPEAFRQGMDTEGGVTIDTREPEGFAGGHIAGTHSIWMGGLPVFGGWIAGHQTPIYLVTESDRDVTDAMMHLTRIGLDGVCGAVAGGFSAWRQSTGPVERSGVTTPLAVREQLDDVQLVDVRDRDEFESGHIPGAHHIYVGHLPQDFERLDLSRERPVVVTCSVGHRAGLAASMFVRRGFSDVRNLLGGMTAWRALELPVET